MKRNLSLISRAYWAPCLRLRLLSHHSPLAKLRLKTLQPLTAGEDLEAWLHGVDRVLAGQEVAFKFDFLLANLPMRLSSMLENILRAKQKENPTWEQIRDELLDCELGGNRASEALRRLNEARQGPCEPFRPWTRRLYDVLVVAHKRGPTTDEYFQQAAMKANDQTLDFIARKAIKAKTLKELIILIEDWEATVWKPYAYPH